MSIREPKQKLPKNINKIETYLINLTIIVLLGILLAGEIMKGSI